ncbi:aminodeoxychorismate lyase [Bacteroidia bacterium]|nr:aminodeoxychorismate lyase [Bacteroidia bacterium]
MTRKKVKKTKKTLKIALIILFILGVFTTYFAYTLFFSPNTKKDEVFFIKTGSSYQDIKANLQRENLISNIYSFELYSYIKKYPQHIKPGKYTIHKRMNNRDLVNMLILGKQTPVKLTFNNIRTIEQLSKKLSEQLEPDSATIFKAITNNIFLQENKLSIYTVPAIFIPNTYEVWWNTSAENIVKKMLNEYHKFWTSDRLQKAKQQGVTPIEVSIIASIIDEETRKNDEKPNVASVYLNRYRKGMLLQADPTVKFAIGDFGLRRILNQHLKSDSPYNTYKHKGLPPGPIQIASISSIESVLNANKTNYLYFCAKEDFSGYHNFAENYDKHLKNAKLYWKALNAKGVK